MWRTPRKERLENLTVASYCIRTIILVGRKSELLWDLHASVARTLQLICGMNSCTYLLGHRDLWYEAIISKIT